jgi:type IV secretory pathway TraG/TraD family ATPase VirD4
VSGIYGDAEAQTIVENCGNTLILRCSASENGGTARFASRLIGEREIVRKQVSKTRQPRQWGSVEATSEQHVTDRASAQRNDDLVGAQSAVMPSEIEQLPDLQGFLKLASRPGWLKVRLNR